MTAALPLSASDHEWFLRELCGRELRQFVKRAWPILEPATPLAWGWALDAMCEHLEAVSRGEIRNLLMNVPPGTMKSLLTSVFWPAWEWGPAGLPSKRFLGTAHRETLATRDSAKMRRLVKSGWYQRLWPIVMRRDRDSASLFENESTGFREAMSFTSMTGSRGDRVILDDPLSVDAANSTAELERARITFTESLPTRISDERSSIVVIMQRIHERDTSGVILDMELDYVHLCLPMRFEAERRCHTVIGFTDPRRTEGELVFPERFPPDSVRSLERQLGSYGTAGQLQQRPAPRGGGVFKREWFKIVDAAPAAAKRVRGWDLGATDDDAAPRTAGVRMSIDGENRIFIEDVKKGHLSPAGVEALLRSTAKLDGVNVRGSLPQDPGQAGKSQVGYLIKKVLIGFNYRATPESGDKETRAQALAAQAEAGNVHLVNGPWIDEYLDELTTFPAGQFSDQVDASSRAFAELVERGSYSLEGV